MRHYHLDSCEEVRVEVHHILPGDLVINPDIPIQSASSWQKLPASAVKSAIPTSAVAVIVMKIIIMMMMMQGA